MARTHARIYVKTWTDPDFRARTADAQRLYFLLLSQADVSHCGVLTYRPKRWALLASDTDVQAVQKALGELEEHSYVIVDRETDEVWIRSFIKHDGIVGSPNMVKAMWNAFNGVLSERIRQSFHQLFDELVGMGSVKGYEPDAGKGKGLGDGGAKPLPHQDCVNCDGSGFRTIKAGLVGKCTDYERGEAG